jgi:hypothetical protein
MSVEQATTWRIDEDMRLTNSTAAIHSATVKLTSRAKAWR